MSEKDVALVRSYRMCFGSPAGREVLEDLMKFCRFRVPLNAANTVVDPNGMLIAEGMRQVFLRIATILSLTPDQITALYGGQQFTLEDEDAA